MKSKSIVIGIVGHPASGKDTVADYLALKGFVKISGGDILRREMEKAGILTDRANMHAFSGKMRKKYGNGYLAEEMANMVDRDSVIPGLRNVDGIEVFRRKFGDEFRLWAIDAPIEVRYQRAKERGRVGDDVSLEHFRRDEENEKESESGSHEVDPAVRLSDVVISNDGTLEKLFQEVDKLLVSSRKCYTRTAVIIKGNPKFIEGNKQAEAFYDDLKSFLGELGYAVTFDNGEPYTTPPAANVWISHSRGADRLRFAPKETKTIALGIEGGINHRQDKALTPGTIPDRYHFLLTDEMKGRVKAALL